MGRIVDKERKQMRCVCGFTMKLKNGLGVCNNCDRTAGDVRDYWNAENAARRDRRGTSLTLEGKKRALRIKQAALSIAIKKHDIEYPMSPDDDGLLGPDEPLNKKRKCHTCKKLTWGFNCSKCRAAIMLAEGVTGSSGTGELFSGALIETGLVR